MKKAMVSARIPVDVAQRLELLDVNVSDIINKALFLSSAHIDELRKAISVEEKKLSDMKELLKDMEHQINKPLTKSEINYILESAESIKTNGLGLKNRFKAFQRIFNRYYMSIDEFKDKFKELNNEK